MVEYILYMCSRVMLSLPDTVCTVCYAVMEGLYEEKILGGRGERK